jgi:hypothetical protein
LCYRLKYSLDLGLLGENIVIDLRGKLIAYPLPNQPGWWAYRELSNGQVLEVELTREEWFELHERHQQKVLDKICALDKHPLNQAARNILKKAGIGGPFQGEICLISLARYALDDDTPNCDYRLLALSEWSRSSGTMQKAIWVLEEAGVMPEDLLSEEFEDAAEVILRQLVE